MMELHRGAGSTPRTLEISAPNSVVNNIDAKSPVEKLVNLSQGCSPRAAPQDKLAPGRVKNGRCSFVQG